MDGGEAARWLIGADGARSEVRRSLGIEFEGFTWPERFLVVSTPFDFHASSRSRAGELRRRPATLAFPAADPGLCRVMFPIPADESDERALVANSRSR